MDTKYAYYSTSKGYRVVGGTAAHFLKADGSLDNNSYALVNLTVPYTGATSDLTLADKNLNFTSGSVSKFENGARIFNKVFHQWYSPASTGILSLKFPQQSTSATMFDVTIKIYSYGQKILGEFRIAFYKNSNVLINPTAGTKAIIEGSDNLPTSTINVGIDANGDLRINLGDITTVWGSNFIVEVERLQATFSGANFDHAKGWSSTIETTDPTDYKSMVNIVPEILATRSYLTSQRFFSANNLVSNAAPNTLTTLDGYLPTGGFVTNYGTPTWGGSDMPIGASYGGFIKFVDNSNINGLQFYFNNGHNSVTAHRLWFRTKNSSNGTTHWFEVATKESIGTSYIPYTGATSNVNLNNKQLGGANSVSVTQNTSGVYGTYVGFETKTADGNAIYAGGVADTVGSYIGQSRYNVSNQYQSNKTYASFVKFGNGGDIYFYGNTGLTANTNYTPTEIAKIDSTGKLTIQSIDSISKLTVNGNYYEPYLIRSNWLSVSTPLTTTNRVAYIVIDGFIVNTNRQLVIEVESIAGNGQYKKLKKVFNINFNSANDLIINGSKYTEITGREADVRYGIGEVEKVSNTSLRIPIIWLSSSSLNINQITIKSAAALILKDLTFSVVYDATSTLTTEVPFNSIAGSQILVNNAINAGGIDISGGNTIYLRNLLPSTRQDANVRVLRNELNAYVTNAGSVNYPTTFGVGIRNERFSSATDQRGFDIFSGGNSGQIYFKTFSGSTTDSNWEIFASREWTALQLGSYVTQASLISQLGNLATLNGVQSFTKTNTFEQNIIIPDATLINHAVNLGVLSNSIDESQGQILGYVGSNYIPLSQKGSANGVATLDASGLIPSTQLPSYIDDVIEAPSLAALNALPAGEKQTGKIYVTTDTNKSYRWSGNVFVEISSGAVQSVNGQTGVVNLTFSDVGASSVNHIHTIAQVTGLQSALDGKVDDAQVLTNVPAGALFTDTIYTLPTATSTVKGGIEIFNDTVQSVASNSVTNTANRTYGIQLNSAGQAVVNVPWSNDNTTYTAGNGLTLSGTVFSLPVTISGSGNYITDVTQNTNGITVTKGSLPSYTLLVATSNSLGGVRLITDTVNNVAPNAATTTMGRSYAVQLNNSNQAIVNVPWTDNNTTYTSSNGIVLTGTNFAPTFGTTANTIAQGNDSRINNGQTAFGYGDHNLMGYTTQAWVDENFVKTNNGISIDITGQNLNTYKKTGFYKGLNLTGAPNDNNGWWYVIIESHDVDSWAKQTATSFGSANVENITYQRVKKMGVWSPWVQIWTTQDFTTTNIQQWNYMAQYGLQLNADFTVHTGSGLMISDDHFGGESGIIDNKQRAFVAAKIGEYYKYGSSNKDGLEGINYHLEKKNIGIGGDADSKNKVRVQGCVKALENFRSKDERPDTIFIPNGETATLRDEIINDESDYAIRLDPHEYEIDPSGSLEVDDRNRLIHVIGEQIKMVVDFRKIYPKQQIVIYNFDQNGGTMAVKIQGKTIANISSRAFLRLYVTRSLRVIAERQQPCEFVW